MSNVYRGKSRRVVESTYSGGPQYRCRRACVVDFALLFPVETGTIFDKVEVPVGKSFQKIRLALTIIQSLLPQTSNDILGNEIEFHGRNFD